MFSLVFLCSVLQAAEYYVSPNGDDKNPGTESQPFRTILHVTGTFDGHIHHGNGILEPGDTVIIRAGTYTSPSTRQNDPSVWIVTSGREGARITVKNYPGEKVIISGDSPARSYWHNHALEINADHITIDGLTIRHAGRDGFLAVDSDYLHVKNCVLEDNSGPQGQNQSDYRNFTGLFIKANTFGKSTGFLIEDTISRQNAGGFMIGINYGEPDGEIYNTPDRPQPTHGVIRNCLATDNLKHPVHGDGFVFRGENLHVYGNISHNTGNDGFDFEEVKDSLFENNISHKASYSISESKAGDGFKNRWGWNLILRNNIAISNRGRGFEDAVGSGTPPPHARNTTYMNNVAVNNGNRPGDGLCCNKVGFAFTGEDAIVINNIGSENWAASENDNPDRAREASGGKEKRFDNVAEADFNFWADGHFLGWWAGGTTRMREGPNTLPREARGSPTSGDPLFNNASALINFDPDGDGETEIQELQTLFDQFKWTFGLQSGSPALQAGTYALRTTEPGTSVTVVPVDGDPGLFFKTAVNSFDVSDVIQIDDGDNNPDTKILATIVSMTPNSITVDSPVTFASGAGVHLPYDGNRPSMGSFEYEGSMPPPGLGDHPSLDPVTTIFVDNKLSAPCAGNTYSIEKRGCSAPAHQGYEAYNTIQAAADRVEPGETVFVRGGLYDTSLYPQSGWEVTLVLRIKTDGTADAPIVFEAYEEEHVILDGRGISKHCVSIESNYVTVKKFELVNAKRNGGRVIASYRTTGDRQPTTGPPLFTGSSTGREVLGSKFVECVAHDNSTEKHSFSAGFIIAGQCTECSIESCLSYHNGGGMGMRELDSVNTFRSYPQYKDPWPDAPRNCAIKGCIAFDNQKNPEHSDGIGGRYSTHSNFIDNVAFANADDNLDTVAVSGNLYFGNILFNANPLGEIDSDGNGLKICTREGGGNLVTHNISFLNPRGGFDDDDGKDNQYINNVAYKNRFGMIVESDRGANSFHNNISFNNRGYDIGLSNNCGGRGAFRPHASDYNYWGDGRPPSDCGGKEFYEGAHSLSNSNTAHGLSAVGDPLFANPIDDVAQLDFSALYAIRPGRIKASLIEIQREIRRAFSLKKGSPNIDAGLEIGQTYSPVDDPDQPNTGGGSHTTYDIGALEFGSSFLIPDPAPGRLPAPQPDLPPDPAPTEETSQTLEKEGFLRFINDSRFSKRPGTLLIKFGLQSPGPVSIEIRTQNGRLIKTFVNEPYSAGQHMKVWDLINDAGERVADGVYLLVMKVDGTAFKKKVVVLR